LSGSRYKKEGGGKTGCISGNGIATRGPDSRILFNRHLNNFITMKKISGILILVVALILVIGCTQQTASPATPAASATPVKTPGSTTTPQTQVTTVNIQNFTFNPATLTVLLGTRITWVNQDDAAHAVAATGANTGLFTSGRLEKGQEFNFVFDNVGVYDYTCTYHPSMRGKIIVKEGAEIVGVPSQG
jgi:plastocyanin